MKLELVPVVRYWESNSKEIFAVIERIRESGATAIAAFVPWTHLETDRHHLLQKLVKQSARRAASRSASWSLPSSASAIRTAAFPTSCCGSGRTSRGSPRSSLLRLRAAEHPSAGLAARACRVPALRAFPAQDHPGADGSFQRRFRDRSRARSFPTPCSSTTAIRDSPRPTTATTRCATCSSARATRSRHRRSPSASSTRAPSISCSRASPGTQREGGLAQSVRPRLVARAAPQGARGHRAEPRRPLPRPRARARACSVAWLDDLFRLRDRERNSSCPPRS